MRTRSFLIILCLIFLGSCTSFISRSSLAEEYYNIGNAFYELGMTEKAVEYYMKAIDFNPRLQDANYNLARAYLEMKQWKSGLQILETLRQSDPENTLIIETMAYAYYKSGEEEKAIGFFETVLEFNEYDQTSLYNLAIIYRNRNSDEEVEIVEAENGEAETAETEPEDGVGDEDGNLQDTAVSDDSSSIMDSESEDTVTADTAVEDPAPADVAPEDSDADISVTDDSTVDDESDETPVEAVDNLSIALGYLLKAYEFNPIDEVLRELGSLYAEMEQPEEALRYYSEYVAAVPEDTETALVFIDLYIDMAQYYNALEKYDELLDIVDEEDKPLILFKKGRVMAVLIKDYQDGLQILEESLEAGFEDKEAAAALIEEAGEDLRLSLTELFTEYELYP